MAVIIKCLAQARSAALCGKQKSELSVPGMETISTRAKMKEHSILDNLAISDLQIIAASCRSGPKFDIGLSCLMRLMLRRRESPPNLKTALWALGQKLYQLSLAFMIDRTDVIIYSYSDYSIM